MKTITLYYHRPALLQLKGHAENFQTSQSSESFTSSLPFQVLLLILKSSSYTIHYRCLSSTSCSSLPSSPNETQGQLNFESMFHQKFKFFFPALSRLLFTTSSQLYKVYLEFLKFRTRSQFLQLAN